MISSFLVRTVQQTRHLLLEAVVRRFPGRRLGVGALRPRLGAGLARLARVATRCGRRGGLFQNSGLLKLAGHLHAGVEQLDCAARRQHNPRDDVPPAGWLGGRRFRLIQAGRAKFEVEASGRRKRTGSRSRRTFPLCRVALPSETASMVLRTAWAFLLISALSDRHYTFFLDGCGGVRQATASHPRRRGAFPHTLGGFHNGRRTSGRASVGLIFAIDVAKPFEL